MNMKSIHFAIFESSLLAKAAMPVTKMYDTMLAVHSGEPDVVSLFSDLKKDWSETDAQYQWKMVKPFIERIEQDRDFVFAAEFAKMGSISTLVAQTWGDMAICFLLKKKLDKRDASTNDVLLGRYLLKWFEPSDKIVENELRTWSQNTAWQEALGVRSEENEELPPFPNAWWSEFQIDFKPQELPSETTLKENLVRAGELDQLPEFHRAWGRYVTAHNSLK